MCIHPKKKKIMNWWISANCHFEILKEKKIEIVVEHN